MATFTGTAGADTITGTAGDDEIYGLEANDTLNGGDGNDIIDGGAGEDVMTGGTGNDTYYVDNPNDQIIEVEGIDAQDKVYASVSYVLSAGLDKLYLTGAATLGVGNATNNDIFGNANANTLLGGGGTDKLYGYEGNDSLVGEDGNDLLYGGDGDDQLVGGDGNDFLTGEAGNDLLFGGLGNDVYIIDDTSDTVVEYLGEGSDIIRNSISWTLGSNFETMQMQGSANIDGTGNSLANNITGNSGNNTLDGGLGVDTLNGGAGNDIIIGGTGGDTLYGGTGSDLFLVRQESFGFPLETDLYKDLNFAEGDRVDLSSVDANSNISGNQAFVFVTNFSGAGGEAKMTYYAASGYTDVDFDLDGLTGADYRIRVTGDFTGTTGDILTGSEPVGVGGWIL